ncbi:hypothetical protein [Helicobacter kayseriensis]|uniref:hypothetical protein n=1 Tax=Helicobacter kayseriensis TaxID=2905877 RepID=UPI001E5065AD|nr:hypothetical protein [Helicobacter kayseriensis]MCE3047808.1 hypothetical protein [Helicobacter kayseriensis]MCE3049171.1 hypothetical protein [Helicobacter kayseriensis]
MNESFIKKAFSKERLESYKNIDEYFDNLKLVRKITPMLQILEVFIRNQVDIKMCEKLGNDWIEKEISEKYKVDLSFIFEALDEKSQDTQKILEVKKRIKKIRTKEFKKLFENIKIHSSIIYILKKKLKNKNFDFRRELRCLFISKMSFGFWQPIIERKRIVIFDTTDMDLEKYNGKIRKESSQKMALRDDFFKNNAIINLLISLRNRAFHGENLLEGKNDRMYAACSKTIHYYSDKKNNKHTMSVVLGIKTNLVEDFLVECIKRGDLQDVLKML